MPADSVSPSRIQSGSSSITDRVDALGLPWFGAMELTVRCNLRCVHCYLGDSADRQCNGGGELTCREATRILDEIAGAGGVRMVFTGGECLLREDFLDIYTHARKCGLGVAILTNGTLLTDRHIGVFRRYPPDMVKVSVYGTRADVYEQVSRVTGSFGRFMRGVELLYTNGITLQLSGSIAASGIDSGQVREMEAFASRFGSPITIDHELFPTTSGGLRPCECAPTCEETVRLEEESGAAKAAFSALHDKPLPKRGSAVFECKVGKTSYVIGSHGELYPCMLIRETFRDLRVTPFGQAWEDMKRHYGGMMYSDAFPCLRCALFEVCAPCPGKAYLANGDFEEPFGVHCRLTKLRAVAFGGGRFKDIDMREGVPVAVSEHVPRKGADAADARGG